MSRPQQISQFNNAIVAHISDTTHPIPYCHCTPSISPAARTETAIEMPPQCVLAACFHRSLGFESQLSTQISVGDHQLPRSTHTTPRPSSSTIALWCCATTQAARLSCCGTWTAHHLSLSQHKTALIDTISAANAVWQHHFRTHHRHHSFYTLPLLYSIDVTSCQD